jgi:hypothetical protein
MKTKTNPIHMAMDGDMVLCGMEEPNFATDDWMDVTCPRCIKEMIDHLKGNLKGASK